MVVLRTRPSVLLLSAISSTAITLDDGTSKLTVWLLTHLLILGVERLVSIEIRFFLPCNISEKKKKAAKKGRS